MPLLGSPISTSPTSKFSPVISSPLGNQPKAVPDKSSSVTIPGSVAVSPPANVIFALLQASASDAPMMA